MDNDSRVSHFENGRPVDEGAYLKPFKKLLVDVTASRANLDKALDLADSLFNELESIGHPVVLASADARLGRERIDERETATGRATPGTIAGSGPPTARQSFMSGPLPSASQLSRCPKMSRYAT